LVFVGRQVGFVKVNRAFSAQKAGLPGYFVCCDTEHLFYHHEFLVWCRFCPTQAPYIASSAMLTSLLLVLLPCWLAHREAANAERFAKLFSFMPEVVVPKMYTEYTTPRVLVMEWIQGDRLRSAGQQPTSGAAAPGASWVG
jgi:hypothetical protein